MQMHSAHWIVDGMLFSELFGLWEFKSNSEKMEFKFRIISANVKTKILYHLRINRFITIIISLCEMGKTSCAEKHEAEMNFILNFDL